MFFGEMPRDASDNLERSLKKKGGTEGILFPRMGGPNNKIGRMNYISPYSKRLNDSTQEVSRMIKDIDKEMKDTRERIKKYGNSVNGGKYEVELRNIVSSLFNAKLSAIKAKADFYTKDDKARKEEIKLMQDLMEAKGESTDMFSSSVGDPMSFMGNIISNQTTPQYNFRSNVANNITPIKLSENSLLKTELNNDIYKPEDPTPVSTYVEHNTVSNASEKEPMVLSESTTKSDNNVENNNVEVVNNETNTESHITSDEVQYITNAQGVQVPLYDEFAEDVIDDFVTTNRENDQSMERSLKVIQAKSNPNVTYYFKYNRAKDMGYIVAVDEETGLELPDVTTLPMDLIYPWTIDMNTNTVYTAIREQYPLLYTDEDMPEHIAKDYEIVYNRVNGIDDNMIVEEE